MDWKVGVIGAVIALLTLISAFGSGASLLSAGEMVVYLLSAHPSDRKLMNTLSEGDDTVRGILEILHEAFGHEILDLLQTHGYTGKKIADLFIDKGRNPDNVFNFLKESDHVVIVRRSFRR